MKITSFILTVYILALSVLPCSDSYACEDSPCEDFITSTIDHSDQDNCTPFCVCSCCAQRAWQAPFFFETRILPTGKQAFIYQSHAEELLAISIWQPPKLS